MTITQQQAQPAINHMNQDHADANVVYVRVWGGIDNAVEATLTAIKNDYMTFDVLDALGRQHNDVKVLFDQSLNDIGEAHKVLVAMVRTGKEKLAKGGDIIAQVPTLVDNLIKSCPIIHLSTTDGMGQPMIGYTQFVGHQNKVYVLMSEMTEHAQNILAGNLQCAVMFTQNPQQAENLAALERFIATGTATEIPFENELFGKTLEKLIARCGDIYRRMANMGDFHMFEIVLNDARYVKGFGLIFDRIGGNWNRAKSSGHSRRK